MIRRLLLTRLRRHTAVARVLAGRGPLVLRASIEQPLLWAIGRAPAPPRRLRAVLSVADLAMRGREPADVGIGPGMEWRFEPGVMAAPGADETPALTGVVQSPAPEILPEDAIVADASVAPGGPAEPAAPRPPALPGVEAVPETPPRSPSPARSATGVPPDTSGRRALEGDMPAPVTPVASPSPTLAVRAAPESPAGEEPVPLGEIGELPFAEDGGESIAAIGPATSVIAAGPVAVTPGAGPEAQRLAMPAVVAEETAPTAPARAAALEPAAVAETDRLDDASAHPVTPGAAYNTPPEVHPVSPAVPPPAAPAAEVHAEGEPSAASPSEIPFDRSPAAWLDRLRGASAPRSDAVPAVAPEKPARLDHAATTPEEAGPAQQPAAAPPTVDATARAWVERQMRGILEQRVAEARRSPPDATSTAPPSPPATPIEMRVARPPRGREQARVAQPGVARPAVASFAPPAAQPAIDHPAGTLSVPPVAHPTAEQAAGTPSVPPVAHPVVERPSSNATPRASAPADETTREQAEFDRSPAAWMERLRADARRRQEREARAAQSSQPASPQPPVAQAEAFLPYAPGIGPGTAPDVTFPGVPSTAETAWRTGSTGTVPPSGAGPARPGVARPARFVPPRHSALPLPEPARRFLRAAVGVDPATVRMSRGPEAGRVAAAYRADAVTVDEHVALAPGEGDTSPEGLGLLAHELTHVARRRDPGAIPPIARPPARAAGLVPASPGPGVDEEALARTVEAQTIQAARARFVPPMAHASGGASIAMPGAATRAVTRAPAPESMPPKTERQESIPADEARARWGNLPAPWEPLPDWLATLPVPATVPALPAPILAAEPPAPAASQAPASPVVRAAETARDVPTPERSRNDERQQEVVLAPDLDALARQVYAVLKRRLAAERRRLG